MGTFAASLFLALVLGMLWKGGTKEATISSAIVGIVLNCVLEVVGKYGFAPLRKGVFVGAFTFAVSLVIYIAVSMVTGGKTNAEVNAPLEAIIDGN